MFLDLVLHLAVFSGNNFHQPAWSTNSHLGLVRTNVRGENGVVFIPECHEPLSCGDVPHDDAARFGAASSGSQQQLAIATELHLSRLAFSERKNTEQRIIALTPGPSPIRWERGSEVG